MIRIIALALLPAWVAWPQQKPLIADVHQHFSSRAGCFEDLDRTYRAGINSRNAPDKPSKASLARLRPSFLSTVARLLGMQP